MRKKGQFDSSFWSVFYLLKFLDLNLHRRLVFLLILMILATVAELASISLIIPFLGMLLDSNSIFSIPWLGVLIQNLSQVTKHSENEILIILFCIIIASATLIRILLDVETANIARLVGVDLVSKLYSNILHQNYVWHKQINHSETIASLTVRADEVIIGAVMGMLTLLSSILIGSAIILLLLTFNPETSFLAVLAFGTLYCLIFIFLKPQITASGKEVNKNRALLIRSISEGTLTIKDILIGHQQPIYIKNLNYINDILRRSSAKLIILKKMPRHIVEGFAIYSLVLLIMLTNNSDVSFQNNIPFFAALAFAAQKLLPLMQNIYSSFSDIQAAKPAVQSTISLIKSKPIFHAKKLGIEKNKLEFKTYIELINVSFRHSKAEKWVLKSISLKIKRGEKIGIIGPSGCGKTTLIDVIMGLLEPQKGKLVVDDTEITQFNLPSFQRLIAHVPQNVHIADADLEENIALGVDKNLICYSKLLNCIKRAQLSELHNEIGLNQRLGQAGALLSGGQRQRIGIARALYRDAKIIILDEPTSALDKKTETTLSETLASLSAEYTVFIISHRTETLKFCNRIIRLKNGRIEN